MTIKERTNRFYICIGKMGDNIQKIKKTDSNSKDTARKGKSKLVPILGIIISLALIVVGVLIIVKVCNKKDDKTSASGSEISIILEVNHGDGIMTAFEVKTEREYLGDALLDEGLIAGEKGDYGLFVTTVDGETADQSKDEWWCLTKSLESVSTGVDSTPIVDGDKYELSLKTGYDVQ